MLQMTEGIVLGRRSIRERDRLVMLYTRRFGRLRVRFIGVDRPNGKLKAFTEPFARADYRVYLKPDAEIATAAGGAVLGVYPAVRGDYNRTLEALYFCELMTRLTPEQQPNPKEYELLAAALDALERGGNRWLAPAYALRLSTLAGFGLSELPLRGLPPGLWDALHTGDLDALSRYDAEESALFRVREALRAHLDEKAGQSIKSERFLNRVPAAAPVPMSL